MGNLNTKLLLGHLSSAVGHHVINAYSTIVSQGEILRSLTSPDEQAEGELLERVETIIQTALDASLMTRRMIEISHDLTSVESEHPLEPVERIQLERLATEVLEARRERLAPAISVAFHLASVPAIRGQADALRAMLELLFDNAIESLPEGRGTISVTAHVDARNWVVLEIRDEGCGMQPEVMERAVEPFFSTKANHRGIGLTIARGIWRRHRGTLSIESQFEKGTLIRLSIAAPPPQ
jgi:two-component system NtrC family sensor kinase